MTSPSSAPPPPPPPPPAPQSQSSSTDETLPTGRVVRWVMLATAILFSVGLYFRFGSHTPAMGTAPVGADTTSTP